MNDFFNVLDDFELEEFAPASELDGEGTFSLDAISDNSASPDVNPEDLSTTSKELAEIKEDPNDVTEEDIENGTNYVWSGNNPFGGNTGGVYLEFSNYTADVNDEGLEVRKVSRADVSEVYFTTALEGFEIAHTNVAVKADAGVSLNLSNGRITGGSFYYGDSYITISTLNATDTELIINVNDFSPESVSFEANDQNLLSITTPEEEGSVEVNDDNFTFNGETVRIKAANFEDGGTLFIGYDEDGNTVLDLSNLGEATDGTPIQVVSAGGADILLPPDAETELKIGSTKYTYALGTNSNAYFALNSSGTVTGFVLDVNGDAITIEKNQAIAIYDADDPTDAIVDSVTGNNYTVTKLVSSYQIEIKESTSVTIGDNSFNFELSKATRNAIATSGEGIIINFDEDGTINSVNGVYKLTNEKDTFTFTGKAISTEEDGLIVVDTAGANQYISVSDGYFKLTGGAVGEQQLQVNDKTTVYGVYDEIQVVVDGTTVSDPDGTYVVDGGYLMANSGEEVIYGYRFTATGDSVELPTDLGDFQVVDADGVAVPIPDVTAPVDNKYTLTKTDDGYKISDLDAGSVVEGITFADADGEVYFDDAGDITGTSENNVTFTGNELDLLKAGGFKVGDVELPAITDSATTATYDPESGLLTTDANKVYALGESKTYGDYTYTGETDKVVEFTTSNGAVTAINQLHDGTVSGDFTGLVSVNDEYLITTDTLLAVTGGNTDGVADTITAVSGLDEGVLQLDNGDVGMKVNGDQFTQIGVADGEYISVEGDGSEVTKVTGLGNGDAITLEEADEAGDAVFVFEGDSREAAQAYGVNGVTYTIENDADGVSITGAGDVEGLDPGARITSIVPSQAVTVNGDAYDKSAIDKLNADTVHDIIGYSKKDTTKGNGSYQEDPNYPLILGGQYGDDWDDVLGKLQSAKGSHYTKDPDYVLAEDADLTAQAYAASVGATYVDGIDDIVTVLDYGAETTRTAVVLNDEVDRAVIFNNVGNNVAVVTDEAEGNKVISLGAKGDVVVMDGDSQFASVSITGGAAADTVVVTNSEAVTFNMDNGGADKVIVSAEANANISLLNYDEYSGAGIVVHDPEIPYIKDLRNAIEDGLLLFEDGKVIAIDRDEEDDGTNRKSEISVTNKDSKHQTMVRLFGYKDHGDTYSDDDGQLVGFTSKAGGTLDASDIEEDVILVGNYNFNGRNKAGSNLKTGVGSDTVFAGGNDTIDTGDGVDLVVLDGDMTRDAATIIVGKGAGDIVDSVKSGFKGDIFDVTSFDGKLDYVFTDGQLAMIDKSSESTLYANTDETDPFIEQRFINGSDYLYAAIATEGGTITVKDDNDTIPNYYLAKDGAIDFSSYSGYVGIDVDGQDLDYPSAVNGTSVSIGSSVNTLIGGTGTTIFKGGEGNETLVAGTGESSLYGGGGQNVLVGNTTSSKTESTEFFAIGIHNGAQNTITGFEFIASGATNTATFDNLNLGLADGNEVTDLKANADGSVSIAVKGQETGATEKATIVGAAGNEFLVDRGTDTETVAQIAASVVTVNNSYVDFYAATETNATVQIGANIGSAKVWLEAPDFSNGVEYVGDFSVIDARGSAAEVEMAGNNVANTIYGGLGNASMWGGAGNANDVMVGGTAHNEYYYEVGNGNDTILSARDGDIVHLGMSLDQVNFDATNISANGIEVTFNDGGKLNIDGGAEVSFSFDDGTNVKANRQTGQFE